MKSWATAAPPSTKPPHTWVLGLPQLLPHMAPSDGSKVTRAQSHALPLSPAAPQLLPTLLGSNQGEQGEGSLCMDCVCL